MSQSVHFNFRILRIDGRPTTAREVVAALRFFLDHRRAPDGYRMEVVAWRQPGKLWRYPTSQEDGAAVLENFWHVLYANGLQSLRLGGVKGDAL